MVILPKNYEQIYPCVNECGSTSKIYANSDYTEAYKIYRSKFGYKKEKFEAIQSFDNDHFLTPKDTITIEDNEEPAGYKMKFDNGISIPKLPDAELNKLIIAALILPSDIKVLSSHNFLITDPNPDNIIFSDTYKFVDTYSFVHASKFNTDLINQKNTFKTNTSILTGFFGASYYQNIFHYLKINNPKYLELLNRIQYNDPKFVYDILSLLQEATKENSLQKVKKILLQ